MSDPIKKSSRSYQLSKKSDNLKGNLKEIYRLLSITPTFKFALERSGMKKSNVSRDIKKLEQRGLVKRIDRGVYKVIQKDKAVSPSHHFLCLHDLEIEFRIAKKAQEKIKSTVIKSKQGYNVHNFGNAGQYFELETTGLITKENLYMFFPKDWELQEANFSRMVHKLYDVIEQTAHRWEERFKVPLFKDGRVNFYITNGHVAYEDGTVIHEFEKNKIEGVVIKDSGDGKVRFVIDMSKKYPHIETKHPQKQIMDIKEVEYWGNSLMDGSYKDIHEKSKDFFSVGINEVEHKFQDAIELIRKSSEGQIQIGQVLNQITTNLVVITKDIYEIKDKLRKMG